MPYIHHADPEEEEDAVMWCEACEDSVCECETLGSQDTWSEDEEATTSDEEFIAPEGSVHTCEKEDGDESEESFDFDEEDTEDEL
jgi:hypothetical protein